MKVVKSLGVKSRKGKLVHMSIGKCDFCGTEHELSTDHINNRSTERCSVCKKVTHGLSKHPLYSVWKSMVARCYNPKNKHYKNYGGDGVTVCEEWKDSVTAFVEWGTANGYKPGLRIDKDVKSGDRKVYSPSTCQFVTNTVNNRATRILRKTNTSGYRGVYFNKAMREWAAAIKVNYKTIVLGLYSTALEAAKAYDSYINTHNLEHTKNGVLRQGEQVLPAEKHLRKDSTSGYTGVSYNKRRGKWRVGITNGKRVLLDKFFTDKREAVMFRDDFIIKNDLPHKLNLLKQEEK